jgi:hypothetical protein
MVNSWPKSLKKRELKEFFCFKGREDMLQQSQMHGLQVLRGICEAEKPQKNFFLVHQM